MFLEDRVNVGGVRWLGGCGDDVCKHCIRGEVATAERAVFPGSAVLIQYELLSNMRIADVLTWHLNVALMWVLLTAELGRSVICGPTYAFGKT